MRTISRLSVVLALLCLVTDAKAYDSNCAFEPGKSQLSRIVAIDSAHGPLYHALSPAQLSDGKPAPLTLNDHEIMLIFRDGPQSPLTTYILDILDKYCVKATFFVSPRAAAANSKLLQSLERLGHTVVADVPPARSPASQPQSFQTDVETSFTAVTLALGKPVAPFILTNDRMLLPEDYAYLTQHNMSLWQVDVIAGDMTTGITANKLANQTIARIHELGRGILLLHDTKKVTVDALDSILFGLKQEKFKVVHVVANNFFAPSNNLIVTKPAKHEEKRNTHQRAQHQLLAEAKRQVHESD